MSQSNMYALARLCFVSLVIFEVFVVSVSYKEPKESVTFQTFIRKYNRTYRNSSEFDYRFNVFQQSLRRHGRLNSARRHDYDAWYGVNQFSDLTPEEFKAQYLSRISSAHIPFDMRSAQQRVYEFSKPDSVNIDKSSIPRQFDWRKKGVIGPVRNQGTCGACWAFSVVETAASVVAMRDGSKPTPLSPQQLVDCALGNSGCRGGDTCRALKWLMTDDVQIVSEKAYPYVAKTDYCTMTTMTGVKVDNFTCEKLIGFEPKILSQLVSAGPLAVAVDGTTWHDYMGGIIQYHCGTSINHAVQIVGYDLSDPVPYYIVRNQWGEGWGLDGYLLVKIGKNICGIATEVVSIEVK